MSDAVLFHKQGMCKVHDLLNIPSCKEAEHRRSKRVKKKGDKNKNDKNKKTRI